MRLDHRALWTAWIAMAALGPLPPADGQEKPQPGAAPASADAGENETRLTMDDIQHMRRQRTSPEQVVDSVAERGRDFEVTAEVVPEGREGIRRRILTHRPDRDADGRASRHCPTVEQFQ